MNAGAREEAGPPTYQSHLSFRVLMCPHTLLLLPFLIASTFVFWNKIVDHEPIEQKTIPRRNLLEDTAAAGASLSSQAYFEGYPLTYKESPSQSIHQETLSHCVGENYQAKTSWMHRSCHYQFFCFDTESNEFVIFQNQQAEHLMQQHVQDSKRFLDVSQSYIEPIPGQTNTVSIGGINLKWSFDGNFGIPRLRWSPRVWNSQELTEYWELPSHVILVPFHSMNAGNPGHLVWDDFLPIWTLLTMFQLDNSGMELLMMRYILQDGIRGLWASCDFTDENKEQCQRMLRKFLPLMIGLNGKYENMPTNEEFSFHSPPPPADGKKWPSLVCAQHGLAGIGALTDHGTEKLHGWESKDYEITQNHGRGGMLYEFRNFMMQNLNIPTQSTHRPPFLIIFSESSSSIGHRNFDFSKHKQLIQDSFHSSYVTVESYVLSQLSLTEQVQIVSQASIFITSCGGGAVTSMFLPRGSSVIMFYLEYGGIVNGKESNQPARLDWDLFNNMSYLKIHWLPGGSMKEESKLQAFLLLIQHELDGLIREKSYDHFFQ
ncbi:DUF563 domain containing protein [Nitzschia inconspicua]|uniref:DUF563 domain containing protein n=1 Tax=Nitzschia inconspicua TaxID=303405 RepID=A0A9K3PU93_9STRA|nr:DUF563 domain containing protein [Nitzschia inconspicua]